MLWTYDIQGAEIKVNNRRTHQSGLDLTVAMSTFNRKDWAIEALESLAKINVPQYLSWEVIVIDNNSADGTWAALHEYHRRTDLPLRIIKEEAIGLSRARNRIIREARGEIISLFDDDERFDGNYLHEMVKVFSDPVVDMVCGRIHLDYEGGRPQWMQDNLEGFLSRVDAGDQLFRVERKDFVFSGGNLAFRKRCVGNWGDFDVNLSRQGKKVIGGGDVKFCMTAFHAGAKIMYAPDIVLYHKIPKHRATKQHFRQLRFRDGEGAGYTEKQTFERDFIGIPLFALSLLCKYTMKYLGLLVRGDEKAFRQQLNVVHHIGWMYGLVRKRLSSAPA